MLTFFDLSPRYYSMKHRIYIAGTSMLAATFFALGMVAGYRLHESRTTPTATFPATVISVVDGDTFDVSWAFSTNERIRVLGIEAPETHRGKKLVQQSEIVEVAPTILLTFGKNVRADVGHRLTGKEVELVFPSGEIELNLGRR